MNLETLKLKTKSKNLNHKIKILWHLKTKKLFVNWNKGHSEYNTKPGKKKKKIKKTKMNKKSHQWKIN